MSSALPGLVKAFAWTCRNVVLYGRRNMHAQSHQSDPRILVRRTLARDHRFLAGLLRPGQSVLDVGCGLGAITAGIAKTVGPAGNVIGLDRDETLLQLARTEYRTVSNLEFVRGDAIDLDYHAQFDIVTAARTLQWIAEPALAISQMRKAIQQGGRLVVLDYNHLRNHWSPEPPYGFSKVYQAFLAWRQANCWDNEMAEHLPELFHLAGLDEVESYEQDEVTGRGDPLWSEVMQSLGEQVTRAGFCTETELKEGQQRYYDWSKTGLIKQTLSMQTVVGRVPASAEIFDPS